MRWVLTLATAVLCATPIIGNANTWYIDNAVPSPGNGSSWSFAWKRFADISWDVIRAGDTICILGGLTSQTYNETLSVGASGSSAGPITITKGFDAGHSGIVIIDGENRLPNGVYIDGHDNVTVENLSIRNIADAGISIEYAASGVNIQNNSVYSGNPGGGNARGYDVRNSSGVIVSGNSYSTPANTPAQTDGLYSQNNNNVIFEYNHIVVSNSDTTGHSDDFQSHQDTNVIARYNWLQQANTAAVNNHGAWISDGQTGGVVKFYNNVVLVPNLSNDSAVTDYIESTWSGTGSANFWNNTIIGGGRGVNISGANLARIQNNIIEPHRSGFGIVILPGTSLPASAINNNLIWAPGASIANLNNVTLTWAQWQARGYDTHGVNADPQFTNAAKNNFTLRPTSPAIDTGTALPGITTDYTGTPRPQGKGYDIGAYASYRSPAQRIAPTLACQH